MRDGLIIIPFYQIDPAKLVIGVKPRRFYREHPFKRHFGFVKVVFASAYCIVKIEIAQLPGDVRVFIIKLKRKLGVAVFSPCLTRQIIPILKKHKDYERGIHRESRNEKKRQHKMLHFWRYEKTGRAILNKMNRSFQVM